MTNKFILKCNSKDVYTGFRNNKKFIKNHFKILNMLSDDDWRQNPYMNDEKKLSSPTRKILGIYFCNILTSLLIDFASGRYDRILIIFNECEDIDPYSYKILHILQYDLDIPVEYIKKIY